MTRNVLSRLRARGIQIANLGMQTIGEVIKDSQGNQNLPARFDPWLSDILENYLRSTKPDILVTCLDVWLDQTAYLTDLTRRMNVPWICHVTINSEPLSPHLQNRIINSKIVVAPSKYNLRVLLDGGITKSIYIPHGVDLKQFYPVSQEEKDEMKKWLGVENKFVFLCVNRNKGLQKNFQQLFGAYQLLIKKNPEMEKNSVLLLLNDPNEIDGFPLLLLRDRMGLTKNVKFICSKLTKDWRKVVMTYEGDPQGFYSIANFRFEEKEMRKIYGMADVHVSMSQGESFGLPILESMACGIPQIFPNHSVGQELIAESGSGLLVNVSGNLLTPLISNVFFVDEKDAMEKMERMYLDGMLRKYCGNNALKFAQKYSWDGIVDKWQKLFEAQEYLL